MKTIHVIIDPQNDFIDDQTNSPSLAVNGALENMRNINKVLLADNVNEVLVTLDTHAVMDIAHTAWWRDASGKEISPFTAITSEDIKSGKYLCADSENTDYSIGYAKTLEDGGKYTHFVWPNHCIVGSKGHEVHALVKDALTQLQLNGVEVNYLRKGMNPKTEHYSAFKAEVPVEGDPSTQLDIKSINHINQFDKIVFSGEAQSHCVRASVLDFMESIPVSDRSKVVLLTDCMASVPGFEKNGEDFIEKAKELGAQVMTSTQYISMQNRPRNKI